MPLTKEITRLPQSAVRMDVTLPKEDFYASYIATVDKLSADVTLPGFRKGKAPRAVLERKFGSALQTDVMNEVIQETVDNLLKDESFPRESLPLSYSTPRIEGEPPKFDLEADFKFSVTWDAKPELAKVDYEGIEIEMPDVHVAESDIDAQLEELRERNAMVEDKSAGSVAEKGDVITCDITVFTEDGAVDESLTRKSFVFTIGNGSYFKIDDDVLGMKVDEEKSITRNFDEDGDITEDGSARKALIKVKSIKTRLLPDMDDDFAQDVNEKFATFADLKANIVSELEGRLDYALKEAKKKALRSELIVKNPMELPEEMIQYQIFNRLSNTARQFGLGDDFVRQSIGREDSMQRFRPEAENTLKTFIIEEKLLETLKVEVTDEERRAAYAKMAERSGETVEEVEEYWKTQNEGTGLDLQIKDDMLYEELAKHCTIKQGKKMTLKEFDALQGGNRE